MTGVRETASAAGLQVSGFLVVDPGPGPARPAYIAPGTQLPVAEANAYHSAPQACDAHQLLREARDRAGTRVREVRDAYTRHSEAIAEKHRGLSGAQWLLNSADIAGGIAGGGEGFYRGADDARNMARSADDLVKSADELQCTGRTMPLKLGGGLAVAGIAYDISNGKDPMQATVAGGLGFGASVAAGAAMGTLIPVPIVGTAVGAVVGAGVGIFTSGMVDNLFEGGDVGDAAAAGVDAVADTGGAIVAGVESVGSTIGGLFD